MTKEQDFEEFIRQRYKNYKSGGQKVFKKLIFAVHKVMVRIGFLALYVMILNQKKVANFRRGKIKKERTL